MEDQSPMKTLLVLGSLSVFCVTATVPAQAMTDRVALKALVSPTIATKVGYLCGAGRHWSRIQKQCVSG